jgi:VanZ family protein
MSFRGMIVAVTNSAWTKAASGLCLLFIAFYSLIPQTERIGTGVPGKDEHVLAYSVTGLLLSLSFRSEKGPLLAAVHLTWIACLLEFLQQWAPGRHPRMSDAVISAAAGVLGSAAAAWLRRYARTS